MDLSIRRLEPGDAPVISESFDDLGWSKPVSQYVRYHDEQIRGERVVLVAWCEGQFTGYGTIVWHPHYPYFKENNIPEIQDLNVLPPYRRKRIATRLMDELEAIVAKRARVSGIGVGLHPGYNAAQRMYVLRGYVPDGRGVSWKDVYIEEGEQVIMDDDLILHLTKNLSPHFSDEGAKHA